MRKEVEIFTREGCKHCARALSALKEAGWTAKEHRADVDDQLRQAVKSVSGRSTVPQVFVGSYALGGADETVSALHDGSLEKLAEEHADESLPDALQEALKKAESKQTESAGQDGDGQKGASPGAFILRGFTEERYKQLRSLAQAMAKSIHTKKKNNLRVFSGQKAAEWLKSRHDVNNPEQVGRELVDALLLHSLSGQKAFTSSADEEFSLQEHIPEEGGPLNAVVIYPYQGRRAEEVATTLQQWIDKLLAKFGKEGNKKVDYKALSKSDEWAQFKEASAELQAVNPLELSRNARMAFFINIYNTLIVHQIVERGTNMGFANFFNQAQYDIGGHVFSAQEIEDGVLRGNKPSAGKMGNQGPLGFHDPRRRFVVLPPDPRIHFTLNCGASSCPPISTYSEANLEEGLAGAAAAYLTGETKIDEEKKTVWLSKLFKFFSPDFGGSKGAILRSAASFLEGEPQKKLNKLIEEAGTDKINLKYLPYDWSLNQA